MTARRKNADSAQEAKGRKEVTDSAEETLQGALENAKAIVCAGTGGVGKTSISAAIAVAAALAGRHTLVLTIDPARRLADAFGLDDLSSTPQAVDLSTERSQAKRNKQAPRLDAMMLDPKPTFDGLVDRFAENNAARDRILGNRIYRHVSETLAGSTEYAAMIQVHDLVEAGEYDLIVVDTPPADHALDFLRAPRRMREFLEGRFVRTLLQPALSATKLGARIVGQGLKRFFSLIDRVAGGGFLEDVTEFVNAVDGLNLGFEEKSRSVEAFLLGEETRFILVSGAQERSMAGALDFLEQLDAFRVPLAAVVVNRLRPWFGEDGAQALTKRAPSKAARLRDEKRLSEALEAAGSAPELGAEVVQRIAEVEQFCLAQQSATERLAEAASRRGVACLRVPEFAQDIDRRDGLLALTDALLEDASR